MTQLRGAQMEEDERRKKGYNYAGYIRSRVVTGINGLYPPW